MTRAIRVLIGSILLFPLFLFFKTIHISEASSELNPEHTPQIIIGTDYGTNPELTIETEILEKIQERVPEFQYNLKHFSEFSELLNAIKSGDVDMSIALLTVTADRVQNSFDFSFPYFSGSQKIFVREPEQRNTLTVLWKVFSSKQVLQIIILYTLIIIIFAHTYWAHEKYFTTKSFISKKYFPGIFQCMWFVFNVNSHIHIGKENTDRSHW